MYTGHPLESIPEPPKIPPGGQIMNSLTGDLLIIFFLILLNGFFSAAEIAVISLRKSRLKAILEGGDKRAGIIDRLQSDPDTFFATVQIGVTLVGTFASVFGGARLVEHVAPLIRMIPFPVVSGLADEISLVLLVLAISYTSLVLGELVPKSLALSYAEKVALVVAYPLQFFSNVFYIFTQFLTFSSNLLLRFFKDRTSFSESRLVHDEIRHLLEEGVRSGDIEHSEHEIIENVLEINETTAREVMVPRVDVRAISVDLAEEELPGLLENTYSRLPVFHESLDHVVGILHLKDLIRHYSRNDRKLSIRELVRPAFFVPETMKIGKILKEMQKKKSHMAVVVDEFGGTAGLLTMEDILEEIVGEIQDVTEKPEDVEIYPTGDGGYLVAGSCSISDFNAYFHSTIPESDSYTSIAGYVLHLVGRFPEVGESIASEPFEFRLEKRVRQKMVQFRIKVREEAPEKADLPRTNGDS